jgi:hypothetical protein
MKKPPAISHQLGFAKAATRMRHAKLKADG